MNKKSSIVVDDDDINLDGSKRRHQSMRNELSQSWAGSISQVSESINVDHIQFITEKQFKKATICQLCDTGFGQLKDRQHHCRICANTVCKQCSSKRVNQQRVCDLCFLKLQNAQSEAQKRKLLKLIQNRTERLSFYLQLANQEVEDLSLKIQETENSITDNEDRYKEDRERLTKEFEKLEEEQKIKTQKIDQFNREFEPKSRLHQVIMQELEMIDDKVKSLEIQENNKKQSLAQKNERYEQLLMQKQIIESSSEFQQLPQYARAVALNQNDQHLSETVISLAKSDDQGFSAYQSTLADDDDGQLGVSTLREFNIRNQ